MNIHKYKVDQGSIQCQICFNEFCLNETYARCKNCQMEFCRNCLKESMINYNSAFSFSGDVFNLQCPGCQNVIEFTTIMEFFGKNFYYKELIPKMTDVKSKYLLTEKIKDLSVFLSENSGFSDRMTLYLLHDVLKEYSDFIYEVDGKKVKYSALSGKSFNCLFDNFFEFKTNRDGAFYAQLLSTFVKIIDTTCYVIFKRVFIFDMDLTRHIQLLKNIKPHEPQTLIDYLLKQEGTFIEYLLDEQNEIKIIDFIAKQHPDASDSEILEIFSRMYSDKNIAPLKCFINEYYEEIYLLLYITLYKKYLRERSERLSEYRQSLRQFMKDNNSSNPKKRNFRTEFKCPSCEIGFLNEKYVCNCCKQEFCEDCLVVLEPNHKCKSSDKATVKMIKETTRPCPKCASRIYRISGCNQMFCTTCHTGFDWETGKIIKSNFHNPHRMEWLNSLNQNQSGTFIQGDIICGYQLTQIEQVGIEPLRKLANYRNQILEEGEIPIGMIRVMEFEEMLSLLKLKEHFHYDRNDLTHVVRQNINTYNKLTIKSSIYRILIEIINQLLVYFDQFYIQNESKLHLNAIVTEELYHRIQPLFEFIDGYVKSLSKMFSYQILVPTFIDDRRYQQYSINLSSIKGSYKKYMNQYFFQHGIFNNEIQTISDELSLDFKYSTVISCLDIIQHPSKFIKRTSFYWRDWEECVEAIKKIPAKGDDINDWNYVINCFKNYPNATSRLRDAINIVNGSYEVTYFLIVETICNILRDKEINEIRPLLNKLLNYYKEFISLDVFICLIAKLINSLYRRLSLKDLIEIFFDYIEFCSIVSYERCNLYFFYHIQGSIKSENKLQKIKYDKKKHSQFAKIIEDVKPLFATDSLFNCF